MPHPHNTLVLFLRQQKENSRQDPHGIHDQQCDEPDVFPHPCRAPQRPTPQCDIDQHEQDEKPRKRAHVGNEQSAHGRE